MPSMAAADDDLTDEIILHCQGHIDRLEVENFKSYAGKQHIGPFKQFTAIIGPNGSGKSNLMDAISFVLGVRTQHLRGSLQELLYSNSDMPAAARPTHGSVTLVYVPDEGQDVQFTRGIQPGGGNSYQSVYRIDGRQVTLEAYTARLGGFGILVKIRNFLVFQGDIEKVAAQTSEGLMQLLEQISGSDALRQPYDDSDKAKDAADKALALLHNRKKAITAERKTRKEQKDEAERFLAKKEELQEQKLYYFLYRLYVHKCDEMAAEDLLAQAQDKLQQHDQQHNSYAADTEAAKKEQAGIVRQRMKLEKEQHKLQKDKEARAPGRNRLLEELGRLKKRIKAQEKALEAAHKEAAEADKGVKKLQQDLKKLHDAQKSAEAEAEGNEELQMNREQLQEYERLKIQAGSSTSKLDQDRSTEEAQLQADATRLDTEQRKRQQLSERAQQALDGAAAERAKVEQLQQAILEGKAELKRLRAEQKQADHEFRRSTNMSGKIEQELRQINDHLDSLRSNKAATEREKRMRDTVATLKKEVPGVHGRVSDLAKVTNKHYQLAMAVALGFQMDAVVVDDKATAFRCIDVLKSLRRDRMEFIPLDSAVVKPLPERLRALGGTARPAIDLLEFEPHLERAMVHACGDAIVCESCDEADDLSRRGLKVKIVSKFGTLFRPNGTFTGGKGGDDDGRAKRWDAAEVDELKAKRDQLRQQQQSLPDVQSLKQRSSEINSQIVGLESSLQYKEAEAKQAAEKAAAAEKEAAQLQVQAQAADPELQQLQQEVASRRKVVDKLTQRINETVDRIFAGFSKKVRVKSVRQWEETRKAAIEEQARKVEELDTQVNTVTSQLEYDRAAAKKAADAVAAKQKQLAKDQEEVAKLAAKKEALEAEEGQHADKAAEMQQQAAELQAQAEQLQSRLDKLKHSADTYKQQRNKLLGEVEKARSLLERIRGQVAELLEAAAMEQVDLPRPGGGRGKKRKQQQLEGSPTMDADGDAEMEDVEEAADQQRLTPASGSAAAEEAGGATTFDFSLLQPRHKQLRSDKDRRALEDELKEAVDSTAAELAQLAPNMKAGEQYAEVREKEKAQNAELEAAKAAATAAAKNFIRIKEQRHARFMRAYHHIKDSIDAIYKHLTRSSTHPMGGSAYLSLEDESDPFSGGLKYVAMPPTKRFRDMEQLSGGEKTVAALALLFAIHSYRPSPFFVLDEVDAALDAVNVARVAHYIRSKTRQRQQQQQQEGAGAGSSKGQQQQQGGAGEDHDYQGFQTIVISLKDIFYEKADALVGVCRDLERHCSTTLTLDLERLPPPSEAL